MSTNENQVFDVSTRGGLATHDEESKVKIENIRIEMRIDLLNFYNFLKLSTCKFFLSMELKFHLILNNHGHAQDPIWSVDRLVALFFVPTTLF